MNLLTKKTHQMNYLAVDEANCHRKLKIYTKIVQKSNILHYAFLVFLCNRFDYERHKYT